MRHLALALLPLAVLACQTGPDDGDGDDTDTDSPADTQPVADTADTDVEEPQPTWDDDVAGIFDARCASCHADWVGSYDSVVLRIDDDVLRPRIAEGHRIDGDDQALVLAWIDAGYPEN